VPEPSKETSKVNVSNVNVAVTDLADVIDTVHTGPTTESHPDHESNDDPPAGVAVTSTDVPDR
jgi:hypothetical protein